MISSDAVAWDDDEILSEWAWNDESFVEQSDLIAENSDLENVSIFIEERDL
tara:strand:- start:2546 stop:2698 length:153 start_codon:yes stop_codon:yes gene_type:complete